MDRSSLSVICEKPKYWLVVTLPEIMKDIVVDSLVIAVSFIVAPVQIEIIGSRALPRRHYKLVCSGGIRIETAGI
jgi:hypothetical protein